MIKIPKNISKELSPKAMRFSVMGFERMAKSRDPIHNHDHVLNILSYLSKMMEEKVTNPEIGRLNLDVLVISICWHDIWKSGRNTASSLMGLFYDEIMDGIGSTRIFKETAKREGLEKGKIDAINYAILRHSTFNFGGVKTDEAKVLIDLDKLEMWNIERLKRVKKNFVMLENRIYYESYKKFLNLPIFNTFFFEWSREKHMELKRDYFEKLDNLLDQDKKTLLASKS